jgi:hypothetical protein
MADLGAGVIILIVVWAITLTVLTLFTFVQSPIRFVGLAALVLAGIITLVLTLIPRGDAIRSLSSTSKVDNAIGLTRICILTFLCVTLLVGVVLVLFQEVLLSVFAYPIQKRFVR